MFSDPFTAVMALILLSFIGTLAIFFRIWRELDALRAAMRDIRESLQFYAVDSAQQNRDLAAIIRELRGMTATQAGDASRAENDCLGEILERGLPNLVAEAAMPEPAPMAEESLPANREPADDYMAPPSGYEKLSLGYDESVSAHGEDEDLIRRLGNGMGMDDTQK